MTAGTTVLFVAADRDRCAESADRLSSAGGDGFEVVGATGVDGVRRAVREVGPDCVVFGENPLSSAGAHLMEVVEVCRRSDGGSVPLVLFTDGTYGPGAARSTEGVTDYVRSDTEGAFDHLADRVRWIVDEGRDGDGDWYETLVESMEDGVFVVEDGRIRYANAAMGEAFGVDRGELEGAPLGALSADGLVPEEDVTAVEAAVETVVDGDADALSPQLTVEPVDGDPRTVELRVVALPGASPGGALATVRTVTEYKQAESALEETTTKIRRLHEAAERMRACRTEAELFEHAADAAADLLGADVCGVDERRDGELAPRATVGAEYPTTDVAEGVAGRAFRAGESVLADVLDRPEASPVDGARSVLAVPVEDVGVLRAVVTGGRLDERDRHLAELLAAHVAEAVDRIRVGNTLRERERDLVAERERLLALFEGVPSPVVAYEFRDGRPVVREVNPSFEETFGVEAPTAVGDPLRRHVRPPTRTDGAGADADAGPFDPAGGAGDGTDTRSAPGAPDDGPRPDAPGTDAGGPGDTDRLVERLRSGESFATSVRRETAGGVADFLVHAGPLPSDGPREDGDGGGEGYIVYTDISDQKSRERELAERNERLDHLAEIASVDLRNRLNDARGYLELGVETGDETSFAEVRRAHERMSRLIDDLRFLAGRDPAIAETEPVGLEAATTRAWAGVETGSVELTVEDVTVEADPDRLVELLERLLRNAVDHASPEGVDPVGDDIDGGSDVIVRVRPLGEEGFYVEDTGVGIPTDDPDRLFESGYSTESDAAGLGLTVVRRIAEAHGWSVTATEGPGGGARFEFRTDPEARDADAEDRADATPDSDPGVEADEADDSGDGDGDDTDPWVDPGTDGADGADDSGDGDGNDTDPWVEVGTDPDTGGADAGADPDPWVDVEAEADPTSGPGVRTSPVDRGGDPAP